MFGIDCEDLRVDAVFLDLTLVYALRGVTCPFAIGAGLAEIGLSFASFRSSFSIFFCSCRGRLLAVISYSPMRCGLF